MSSLEHTRGNLLNHEPAAEIVTEDQGHCIVYPSRDIKLKDMFPGLWYNQPPDYDPPFIAKLVDPRSPLHDDFISLISHEDVEPRFTILEVIALALLARRDRTSSARDIARWVFENIPFWRKNCLRDVCGYHTHQYDRFCVKEGSHGVRLTWNGFFEFFCERSLQDLPLCGIIPLELRCKHNSEPSDLLAAQIPAGPYSLAQDGYYLEFGQENKMFAFKRFEGYPTTSRLDKDLPEEVLLMILRSLLRFPRDHRPENMDVSRLGTSAARSLPIWLRMQRPDRITSILRTSKKMYGLGTMVLYEENVFRIRGQAEARLFTETIGSHAKRIQSVRIDWDGRVMAEFVPLLIALGQSSILSSLTMTFPRRFDMDAVLSVLEDFQGLKEVYLPGDEKSQNHVDAIITPWVSLEQDLKSTRKTRETTVGEQGHLYEREQMLRERIAGLKGKAWGHNGPRLGSQERYKLEMRFEEKAMFF
ncbi:unnamed protein product [Periconia digitata]|uniref:Fork-head domain-containing protein n=1 Tax=Periconia digitata TaxID=1303443 RepID=A0A9W4XL60_9PLEO|nr:unnamed protein product [Periconia digitata]